MVFGANVWADSHAVNLDQLDYPELNVVPRASERLHSEAAQELPIGWSYYLPMQVSALTTLAAGIASTDPSYKQSGYVGIIVGGGFFAASTLLSVLYHPYINADQEVSKLPQGSRREQLARERAAEEAIRSAATLERSLKWISIVGNLATSVYMLAQGNGSNGYTYNNIHYDNPNPNYVGQGIQIAAAVMSLAPLIFRNHWGAVADEQEEYRKRIYTPLAHATFYMDPITQKATPGIGLTFKF
jgi:hypothetical protein